MFEHLPGANKVAQDFAKRIKSIQLSNNFEVTDLQTEVGMWNFESSAMIVLDKRIGKVYRVTRLEINDFDNVK